MDGEVAAALGYRFWLEKRGEYRMAVIQRPGASDPWRTHRDSDRERPRYEEVSAATAIRAGFYGEGAPKFSKDIGASWSIVVSLGLSLVQSEDGWYAIKPEDIEHGCVRGTDFPKISLVGAEGQHFEAYPTAPLAVCAAALAATRNAEEPCQP